MKTLTLLLFATVLLTNNFNSPQELPELQEATALSASVVKLFNERKYDEALPLAKRALQIREKLLPANDQRLSDSLTNLGEVYIGKQDYKAARDIFKRLLQIQEQRFGPESLNIAVALDRLAPLHYRSGSFREAEDAYKRALTLREKAFGSNNEQVARSVFALAEFYRARGDFKPSLENYKLALTTYGQLSGINTPEFERVSDGFFCLAYFHKPDLSDEINRMRKQLAGPEAVREPEPGIVLNGRALSLPKPDYPDGARALRLSGKVAIKVWIDEVGNVISAKDMCQGPPYLSEASVAAALRARFTPTKLSGMPIKVQGVILYNFVRR